MAKLEQSQFRNRVLVAALLIPAIILITWAGGILFALVVGAAALIATWEFFRLMEKGGFNPLWPMGLILTAFLVLNAFWPHLNLLPFGLSAWIVVATIWQLFRRTIYPAVDWALTLAGGFYIGWLISHFVSLRSLPNGYTWVLLTLFITWAEDSGAYFVGLKWGKRPIWPRLSPKKTWEGTIGGWLAGVLAAIVLGTIAGIPLHHSLALGIIVATTAPFGDLAVSMIKRQVGAKDSGTIFPGHGGMLDRIDSLLFAAIGVYYYVVTVVF
ncbi:MAG: phosphatidate cytidylyltransferase [Anaerolineae bacterium]|nr:phosphatidate cytidylyltransferase [Anaerolineae bacterium]